MPEPSAQAPAVRPVGVADELVLVAADGPADDVRTDARRPRPTTATGTTAWAARLHDELVARGSAGTGADVARAGSWLQVQAIGASAVAVVEPRCERFASLWAAAAAAAGMKALLVRPDERGWVVAPAPSAASPARAEPAPWHVPGRRDAVRLWLADRAEGIGRRAIRLLQW
jgi:hypothetical protein